MREGTLGSYQREIGLAVSVQISDDALEGGGQGVREVFLKSIIKNSQKRHQNGRGVWSTHLIFERSLIAAALKAITLKT